MSPFILKWTLVWTTNYTATLRIWAHLVQTMLKTLTLLHDSVDIFPCSLTHVCLMILVEGSRVGPGALGRFVSPSVTTLFSHLSLFFNSFIEISLT